jgi:hypothetical protein
LKPITILFKKQRLDQKNLKKEVEFMLNRLLDYVNFLKINTNNPANPYVRNESLVHTFMDYIKMILIETQYETELKNAGIDCIKYFDTFIFEPLTDYAEENAKIIGKAFNWLQEYKNPVRNNVILLGIRCKEIAIKHQIN